MVAEHTTQSAIEQANIEYLPALYLCVDDTSLRTLPLLEEFEYTGDTIAGDEVTAGTYIPPPQTNEYTQLFLKGLKRPDHVP